MDDLNKLAEDIETLIQIRDKCEFQFEQDALERIINYVYEQIRRR